MANVFIGTSGFSYSHWQGIFYPNDLNQKEWLRYYAKHFDTVEINATFYHQMSFKTFKNWREIVGPDFVFSIKASRFITHVKKLKDYQEPLKRLMEGVKALAAEVGHENFCGPLLVRDETHVVHNVSGAGLVEATNKNFVASPPPSLDVVLFQLPPRWHVNPGRLKEFVGNLPRHEFRTFCHSEAEGRRISMRSFADAQDDSCRETRTRDFRFAFEFRDKSWLCQEIYKILKSANCALVIQDSPYWPKEEVITADFTYLRFHGSKRLYSSNYSEKELNLWAKKIKKWLKEGLDVYCYFNNDALGYAIENAKTLRKLVG